MSPQLLTDCYTISAFPNLRKPPRGMYFQKSFLHSAAPPALCSSPTDIPIRGIPFSARQACIYVPKPKALFPRSPFHLFRNHRVHPHYRVPGARKIMPRPVRAQPKTTQDHPKPGKLFRGMSTLPAYILTSKEKHNRTGRINRFDELRAGEHVENQRKSFRNSADKYSGQEPFYIDL